MLKIIGMFLLVLEIVMAGAPSLYPSILEIELKGGRGSGVFTIYNNEDISKRYELAVKEVDNYGKDSLLGRYMKIYPRLVEIAPGKKRDVRYVVKGFPQGEVEDGEYKASIRINELTSSVLSEHKLKEEVTGIVPIINLKVHTNMGVYGYVGKLVSSIESDLKVEGNQLKGKVRNTGNYSYKIKARFLDITKGVIEEVELSKLMDDDTNSITIDIPKGATEVILIEKKMETELYRISL